MLMLLIVHMTSVLFLVRFDKFCPDYGPLLELHALTLVAHPYPLLTTVNNRSSLLLCIHDQSHLPKK